MRNSNLIFLVELPESLCQPAMAIEWYLLPVGLMLIAYCILHIAIEPSSHISIIMEPIVVKSSISLMISAEMWAISRASQDYYLHLAHGGRLWLLGLLLANGILLASGDHRWIWR